MLIDAGPRDQRLVQGLADYGLIYCGEPLREDVTIAGEVRVSLAVESNCPDTDFVAKLIDLHPDGCAMLLMDGVTRAMYRDASGEPRHLAPDRVERLTINLGHICHTFGPAIASKSTSLAAISRAVPATPIAAIRYWRTTVRPTFGWPPTSSTTPPRHLRFSSFQWWGEFLKTPLENLDTNRRDSRRAGRRRVPL
jgi:hypothetical protein